MVFEEGTPEELAERRVQELIRFSDPWDNVFELFHGITYESRPIVTPYAASFVTGATIHATGGAHIPWARPGARPGQTPDRP